MSALTRWDSLDARFWAFVDKTETCWLWTGELDPKGYTKRVGHMGRRWRGHQLAYFLAHGDIPAGLVLDHLCRTRRCVRPDHLEPVTAEENTRRGMLARWTEPCPSGHDPQEFRRTLPSGKNVCVACRRESDNARHGEARRAAARARYHRQKATRKRRA